MVFSREWLVLRPWKRHSLVLTVGGLVYIFMGIAHLAASDLSTRRYMALIVALNIFPLWAWGWTFVAAGLLAILSARWPAFSESWGYAVLSGLSSAWCAVYILGYAIGGAPFSNVNSGFIWALITFMWWAVSGLVNPQDTLKVVPYEFESD